MLERRESRPRGRGKEVHPSQQLLPGDTTVTPRSRKAWGVVALVCTDWVQVPHTCHLTGCSGIQRKVTQASETYRVSKAEAEIHGLLAAVLYMIKERGRRNIGFSADIQSSFTKKIGYGVLCVKLEAPGIHVPDIRYKCAM